MGRENSRLGAAWLRLALLLGTLLAFPLLGAAKPSGVAAQAVSVRVPILAYHGVDHSGSTYSVTPEQLEAQCQWLVENGYTAVTIGQFWDAVNGYGSLPPNPVVLTNDDGLPSAMTFADILGRYGLVGTYFINNNGWQLTPDQILSLAQRGSVEAHTAGHVDLMGLDYETQFTEIASNKAYIEQITGQPVRFLAWPFGSSDPSAMQAASAAGIVAAFGLNGTAAHTGAIEPYYIPRMMVLATDDLSTYAAKVSSW
jgi:peptidoglycan/xylan/chitin deacetylase (PgdA/CDA1 family)